MTDTKGNAPTTKATRVRRRPHPLRAIAALAVAVALTAASAACSSPMGLPMSGSVQTLAPVEQQTRRVYTAPQGPTDGDNPERIVEGFFDAMPSGVQSDAFRVAHQFLTERAASSWDGDASAVIYDGTPTYVRKANGVSGAVESAGGVIVEAEFDVVGTLDDHGLFTPAEPGEHDVMRFTLTKTDGEWRIAALADGVAVSSSDFDQVFRQVSVYRIDKAGRHLVPDVRWLGWRNWRAQAVREALRDGASWLSGAVRELNPEGRVSLDVDVVPLEDNVAQVQLNAEFLRLEEETQALLVHAIRLTLADGVSDAQVRVAAAGEDCSGLDQNVKLDTQQPSVDIHTLTGGRIVSLGSSSPLRVGDTGNAYEGALGFAFGADGGAVLRADGRVDCVKADASSCGALFVDERMKAVSAGLDGEIWAVGADGRSLHVSRGGSERVMEPAWLDGATVTAVALSPEGARMAVATDRGVYVSGVERDDSLMPQNLSETVAKVSGLSDVTMLTFYNELNLVYVTSGDGCDGASDGSETSGSCSSGQEGYRQIAPGPPESQRLPETTVTALASGQIALYRRLAVLDDLGIVRSVSGSLDGSWSMADSQVTALGAQ